jgi:hypothetical protein
VSAATLCFSLPEMPTTARLDPDLRALAQNQARARGYRSLSKFIEWCVRQALTLEFLTPDNRDFVHQVRQALGGPWQPLDVINALVASARKEIAAGRLRPAFWSGQFDSVMKREPR